MLSRPSNCLIVFIAFIIFSNGTNADDWRQWRGEHRDGRWNETGIVESFTTESLKVLWSQDIESGYCGPTVSDGRVFVMDRQTRPEQKERILCFDSATGEPLWVHTYDSAYVAVGYVAGPRASVSIDEDRAYALGTMGNMNCLNVSDGSVIWQRDLNTEYGFVTNSTMPIWGISANARVITIADQVLEELTNIVR